jgi:hypothetical protein
MTSYKVELKKIITRELNIMKDSTNPLAKSYVKNLNATKAKISATNFKSYDSVKKLKKNLNFISDTCPREQVWLVFQKYNEENGLK